MDKRTTNKVCFTGYNGEREEFLNERKPELIRLLRTLELERTKATSDLITSYFGTPDIRRLLCNPDFLLTDFGWRLPMVGRELFYKIGSVTICNDYLHVPRILYSRKGDYKVQYSNKQLIYIWHNEIKDQVNV